MTTPTKITNVTVVGLGLMGFGIALEFARYGYDVNGFDISLEAIELAKTRIRIDLDLMAEGGLISQNEAKVAFDRIHFTTAMEDATQGAQYVIEAATEKLSLKQSIFSQLDSLCAPEVILATNSSNLLVSDISAQTQYPHRILATHYYMPPHLVPLVEVFGGTATEQKYLDMTIELLTSLNKKAVFIENEQFRQIGNLLQAALSKEMRRLVDLGASPLLIDDAVTFGFGRRLPFQGYFKRMDTVGLDKRLERYIASGAGSWALLADKVAQNELGVTTGKGFYEWPGNSAEQEARRLNIELVKLLKQDIAQGIL